MLVLLLIEENSIADLVLKELRGADVNVVHYRDPLRVLDYISEFEADALIVRQKDFPLHAQILAAMIRFYKPLQRCKMIVLGKDAPSFPSCTFIVEELFTKDPSMISSVLFGPNHANAHHGSRLVARAQRMVRD
jgi:hypothetical protein